MSNLKSTCQNKFGDVFGLWFWVGTVVGQCHKLRANSLLVSNHSVFHCYETHTIYMSNWRSWNVGYESEVLTSRIITIRPKNSQKARDWQWKLVWKSCDSPGEIVMGLKVALQGVQNHQEHSEMCLELVGKSLESSQTYELTRPVTDECFIVWAWDRWRLGFGTSRSS